MQFKCKYGLIFKNVSILNYSVYSIHFNISMLLVLFNPWIGPYQVLPLQVRVDLGAIAMKGYSAFPKAPKFLFLFLLIKIYNSIINNQSIRVSLLRVFQHKYKKYFNSLQELLFLDIARILWAIFELNPLSKIVIF